MLGLGWWRAGFGLVLGWFWDSVGMVQESGGALDGRGGGWGCFGRLQ
jgi:hypothetical protein